MFAAVYDRFSALDPSVNARDWNFSPDDKVEIQGLNSTLDKKQEYTDINETIDLKIHFVRRLFSEMGRVRQNVNHVAVIFLDGLSLSDNERRNVSKFKEMRDENITIFLIVFGEIQSSQIKSTFSLSKFVTEKIYANVLIMQICNQCRQGFFPFKNSMGTDSLSCYTLVKSGILLNLLITRHVVEMALCHVHGAYPAHIGSLEELNFLQSRLKSEFYNEGIRSTTKVFIGLMRRAKVPNDRFGWFLTYPFRFRPLVINNWLPGSPPVVHGRQCTAWQFEWSDPGNLSTISNNDSTISNNDSTISNNDSTISNSYGFSVDGWTDVECESEATFSLCEVALARKFEEKNLMTIEPASNERLNNALAKGDFIKFQNNIVSVSTHIVNKHFQKYLTEAKFKLFPLFDCGEDAGEYRYISYMLVCDSHYDCSNGRDEALCLTERSGFTLLKKEFDCRDSCNGVYCCNGLCLPLVYDNDGKINCDVCLKVDKNNTFDEWDLLGEYKKTNESKAFICYRGRCAFSSKITSSMSKCNRPDRLIDGSKERRRTDISCSNALGTSLWAPMCVYVKDGHGTIFDCRRMSHLENCKDFVCPEGYVKCPNTYCIPQHYVLDGQDDCPTGEDEQTEMIGPCTGNFACWDSKVCLHPDLVCDGHPDCPHRDDEIDCYEGCAVGFRCVSGTVTISNYTTSLKNMNSQKYRKARYVDYSDINLNNTFGHISKLDYLMFIDWSNCSITELKLKIEINLPLVQKLDISYNALQQFDGSLIDLHTIYSLRHFNLSHNKDLVVIYNLHLDFLETLDLSHTALSSLGESALRGLPNLKHLDISFTSISRFDAKNKFQTNFYLQTLNVRGLPIDNFYEHFYKELSVSQHLYTDRFELCCPLIREPNIPTHVCHAPDDAISSCSDLIAVNVQRVLLWVVAVLAVLGNLTVIGYRLILDRSSLKTGFGLFVTNLGISDFIMGVYLFIIAVADYYYRDIYVLYDKTWRESIVCRLAGFLATLSSETSTFFVFLITLDRFLMMKFPAGQIKFYEKGKIIALLLSWIVGSILALIPIVFKLETYSSNAVCLGLPLATKRTKGWEFSFSVFIVLNFFLFLVIAYGQRAIFAAMSEKRMTGTASNTSSRRVQDIMVAKQLSLVALSNFLCWFPIGFMGLLSLVGREINNDVYAWTTVIVLPINSAANPLLYTIPVLMDKWDKFKFREKLSIRKAT